MGPHRYLVRARVARVRTLLISGDRSLAAIADETGFSDQSHMSKVFKKFTGMSPKTFRANRTAPRCPVQAWFLSMQENSPVQ
jgi:AraC family transcriptional regulator